MRALVLYLFTLVLTMSFLMWRWRRRAPGLDELRQASQAMHQGARQLRSPNGHHPTRRQPQATA
jgi:hypothetical protein